jgi:outer membrane biogenesis lipoprotein LolB
VNAFPLRRLALALCVAAAATAACAPARVTLPTDAGSPLADLAAVHAQVTRACRGVRTLTAELSLAGRAGRTRLRGRVVAGFERPASMRLEGVAPFGPPAFILVARGGEATLLLPRDERVLTGENPEAVLGALTGVALAPADLLAILTGCVVPEPVQRGGRVHANGWASIDLEGDARLYLVRVSGAWQPRAASRQGWDVQYAAWQGDFPRSVALRSLGSAAAGASAAVGAAAGGAIDVDLTATVSQIEANLPIDAAAFSVIVPPAVGRLTLDELREAGPLRGEP